MKKLKEYTEFIPEVDLVRESTSVDLLIMADYSMAISEIVKSHLQEKGMTQKQLADALGKSEAEISKWLSGIHNFTLHSIAKLQYVLGRDILIIPGSNKNTFDLDSTKSRSLSQV